MLQGLLTVLLTGTVVVGPVFAATPVVPGAGDKDCWLEIFDDDDFDENDAHTRVQGPIELPSLKDLNGRNWANDISSVIVGPRAVARAYSDRNYKGTELAFLPDQRIGDLSDLNMGNTIESLKIQCAPATGRAGGSERGGIRTHGSEYWVLPIAPQLGTPRSNYSVQDATVMDREGRPVGTLERLILDGQTGQIDYGIVSLTQEDRLVAIPWTVFRMNRKRGQPTLAVSREEVGRYLGSEDPRTLSPRLQDIMTELEHERGGRFPPPGSIGPTERPLGVPRDRQPSFQEPGNLPPPGISPQEPTGMPPLVPPGSGRDLR